MWSLLTGDGQVSDELIRIWGFQDLSQVSVWKFCADTWGGEFLLVLVKRTSASKNASRSHAVDVL